MNTYKHLSESDRLSIYDGLQKGKTLRAIAVTLGRDPGTISREVARNKTPAVYLPDTALRQYKERRKHCHPKSRLSDSELRKYILLKLEKGWSPELIAGRLRKRFGRTIVNHETIYKFIYDSEIGKQWKLYEYLPRGKKKRTKLYGRKTNLDEVSQSDLDDIAFEINNRPMKCLNFSTPYEVLLANSIALGN